MSRVDRYNLSEKETRCLKVVLTLKGCFSLIIAFGLSSRSSIFLYHQNSLTVFFILKVHKMIPFNDPKFETMQIRFSLWEYAANDIRGYFIRNRGCIIGLE